MSMKPDIIYIRELIQQLLEICYRTPRDNIYNQFLNGLEHYCSTEQSKQMGIFMDIYGKCCL